ncbi:MAG TPA: cation diffusion facilitator family transporter [Gemmatimonadales bacterium]|nr:cation diffusion facilitator family transporter [Gemmatimonadales bacterium]
MTALPVEVQCAHRAPLRTESRRRMTIVLALSVTVLLGEAIGGYAAHSLALMADAGHMLGDAGAIGLALWVSHIADRPATPERSFGLLRLEILAALINGAVLILIALGIGFEAYRRIRMPNELRSGLMLAVAGASLAANLAGAAVMHRGHQHSLNERGVYVHVLSDALGSLGALVAAGVIMATGQTLADPIVSILIGMLILQGAWRLTRESVDILLEATPSHISLANVHSGIASLPGVTSVHDLHVWTLTSGVVAMSGHMVVRNPEVHQRILKAVQHRMEKLGIQHVTVQIEQDLTCV